MGYKSDAQRKAVHASKADGGAGNPNKMKSAFKMKYTDGKKASPAKMFGAVDGIGSGMTEKIPVSQNMKKQIAAKIDEKVGQKVDQVVNNESEEGLV
jgi:hypothetical protein